MPCPRWNGEAQYVAESRAIHGGSQTTKARLDLPRSDETIPRPVVIPLAATTTRERSTLMRTVARLRRRAKEGDAKAQVNLGVHYATAEGVRRDRAKALRSTDSGRHRATQRPCTTSACAIAMGAAFAVPSRPPTGGPRLGASR